MISARAGLSLGAWETWMRDTAKQLAEAKTFEEVGIWLNELCRCRDVIEPSWVRPSRWSTTSNKKRARKGLFR
jgi:hypothetical protein